MIVHLPKCNNYNYTDNPNLQSVYILVLQKANYNNLCFAYYTQCDLISLSCFVIFTIMHLQRSLYTVNMVRAEMLNPHIFLIINFW